MKTFKTVLITGASSGIGAAMARRYIDSGAIVGVCGRDKERVQSVCDGDSRALPLIFDVTNAAACSEAIGKFEAFAGAIDLAILNAGFHLSTDAAAFNVDMCKQIMEINYVGALNSLAPIIETMKRQGRGTIAMMGSAAGIIGMPNAGAYCASKAAIVRMTEALRVELKAFNIDVRLITPGFIDTPLTRRNDFPMPFLMPVEEAAAIIERGLAGKRYEIAFPWRLVWALTLAALLPRSVYFRLAQRLLPAQRRLD